MISVQQIWRTAVSSATIRICFGFTQPYFKGQREHLHEEYSARIVKTNNQHHLVPSFIMCEAIPLVSPYAFSVTGKPLLLMDTTEFCTHLLKLNESYTCKFLWTLVIQEWRSIFWNSFISTIVGGGGGDILINPCLILHGNRKGDI